MTISIITTTFNSEKTIENTLQSVIGQTYNNIEYIIIDGASTDNTLNILHRYQDKITTIISEPDQGIYDALNKGFQLATGEVIGLMHSDDFYAHQQVLEKVAIAFEDHLIDSLYGDLQYVDAQNTNKVIRNWVSGNFQRKNFLNGWMPPHPTFFARRKVYEQFGYFNLALKSAADYELMLRLLYKEKISTYYLPEVLVKMRVGGQSNASLENRWLANKEDRMAWKLNDLKPRFYTSILKPLRKITQFIEF